MSTNTTKKSYLGAVIYGTVYPLAWLAKQTVHLLAELTDFILAAAAQVLAMAGCFLLAALAPLWLTAAFARISTRDGDSIAFLSFAILFGVVAGTFIGLGGMALSAIISIANAIQLLFDSLSLAFGIVGNAIYSPLRLVAKLVHGANSGFTLGVRAAFSKLVDNFGGLLQRDSAIDGWNSGWALSGVNTIKYIFDKIANVLDLQLTQPAPGDLMPDGIAAALLPACNLIYQRHHNNSTEGINTFSIWCFSNFGGAMLQWIIYGDNANLGRAADMVGDAFGTSAKHKTWEKLQSELRQHGTEKFFKEGAATTDFDFAHRDEGKTAARAAKERLERDDCLPQLQQFSGEQTLQLIEELRLFALSDKYLVRAERKLVQLAIDSLVRHNEQDPASGNTSREILLGYWWLLKQAGYDAESLKVFRRQLVAYISGRDTCSSDNEYTASCNTHGLFQNSPDLQDPRGPDPACHERIRNLAMAILTIPYPLANPQDAAYKTIQDFLSSSTVGGEVAVEREKTVTEQIAGHLQVLDPYVAMQRQAGQEVFAKILRSKDGDANPSTQELAILKACLPGQKADEIDPAKIKLAIVFIVAGCEAARDGEDTIFTSDEVRVKAFETYNKIISIRDHAPQDPRSASSRPVTPMRDKSVNRGSEAPSAAAATEEDAPAAAANDRAPSPDHARSPQ